MSEKELTTALVLEGGGYRGIYTAGVLDVLMEYGLGDEYASVWGVSAGAINAVSFKSRQLGRTMRVILSFRDDPRFMSLMSFVRTGNINGDFMYQDVQNRLDPCDNLTFNQNPMQMYACASDVVFGSAAYLPVRTLPDDVACIQASSSIPTVSQMVTIDGHRYLDGGMADSIPFEAALGLPEASGPLPEGYVPADRVLVVCTKDRTFVRDSSQEKISLRAHRYDDYPYFLETLRTRADRYNAQREHLWKLEEEGTAFVFAPEKPVVLPTTSPTGEQLLDLYLQGRRQAEARIAELDAWLHPEDYAADEPEETLPADNDTELGE